MKLMTGLWQQWLDLAMANPIGSGWMLTRWLSLLHLRFQDFSIGNSMRVTREIF